MTPVQLAALFRSDVNDLIDPFLWTDDDVYSYMDDAQKMFCRLTDGISDATTPEVCFINTPQGTDWIDLHASILKIRGATLASDGRDLEVINYEDMAGRSLRFTTQPAYLRTIIVGMEENKARALRPVAADDAINLLVFRLPLATLIATPAQPQAFEIAEHHHFHLLDWMKHRAFLKQDAECFNRSKATEHDAIFREYCALAKKEQGNKRHKVRQVVYGGIGGIGEGTTFTSNRNSW